ncbi:carbohydrate kinase family protein [Cryptosporangium sp. NPDC051539]|uniref:carbohydrate kinase family protein n=1 Tax=Cryptosporangium sp. NPDC051539 TaxID=3363962 RepID=UPI0037A043D3
MVVGDLATDIVIRTEGPPAVGSDRPAQIRYSGGGAAANTAAWLARAGVPVTLAARVGDDAPGRDRIAELVAAGVEPAVAIDTELPTASIAVLVDGDGERTMFPDRAAADRLDAADVIAAVERPDVRHLHLSGYALLDAGSRKAGLAALETAGRRGITVSVDAASAAPLEAVGAERFLGWIAGIDLLLANAAEAAVLTGLADPSVSAARLATVVRTAVVKDGAGGAWWRGENGAAWVAAEPARRVVDTTGAGDAFAAGLLAAWLSGAGPAGALAAGARAGTLAVGLPGARP